MIRKLLINPKINLRKAIKLLKLTGKKCLVVVNQNNQLLGTLTDGDVRNCIISGQKLERSISGVYNPNPKYLFKSDSNHEKIKNKIIRNRLELLPILNKKNQVLNIITWDQILKNKKLKKNDKNFKAEIVIMAGGKGTRLKPFTNILPKPLIPVNGKAIIEHIAENFVKSGAHRFYITINYRFFEYLFQFF